MADSRSGCFLRAVLSLSAGAGGDAQPVAGGAPRPFPLPRDTRQGIAAPGGLVHGLAGGRIHPGHPGVRPARRLHPGPLPVLRQEPGVGGGGGAVRAADGGGRRRLPCPARPRRTLRRGPPLHGLGDPHRPRFLQLRGGGAHSGKLLGAHRPQVGGGGPGAGCRPPAGFPRRYPASSAPPDRGGLLDSLPVHLHVLRGGADPRGVRLRHHRGGRVAGGHRQPGSGRLRRPGGGAAGRGRRRPARCRTGVGPAPGVRRATAPPSGGSARRRAPPPPPGRAASGTRPAPWRCPSPGGAGFPSPAPGSAGAPSRRSGSGSPPPPRSPGAAGPNSPLGSRRCP